MRELVCPALAVHIGELKCPFCLKQLSIEELAEIQ